MDSSIDSKTFTIFDENNNLNFLADTGSSLSLLPSCFASGFKVTTADINPVRMECASGKNIKSKGEVVLHLKLNIRTFDWTFRVCDVRECILGADFFEHFNLLVHVKARALVQGDDYDNQVNTAPARENASSLIGKDSSCDSLDETILGQSASSSLKTVESILQEFPEITLPMFYNRPVKHDFTHTIDTSCLPISCRPRPLSPEMLKIAKEQF